MPTLYRRVMRLNPAGAQWSSADFDGNTQIGVKNNSGGAGINISDIIIRCQCAEFRAAHAGLGARLGRDR
ncbi:MAG: hypothetical protein ABIR79_11630 [Candidatus Binatia bacterium]